MNAALEQLNFLSPDEAYKELVKCCGSNSWARLMVEERPFANVDELLGKADSVWWSLETDDWLAAFHGHPKIGEQQAAAVQSEQARNWSAQEQSGIVLSAAETKDALAQGNREYEQRFGYIFIVCASGKTAEEMLGLLRERLKNDPNNELQIAAEEQRRITRLRLLKLLDQ